MLRDLSIVFSIHPDQMLRDLEAPQECIVRTLTWHHGTQWGLPVCSSVNLWCRILLIEKLGNLKLLTIEITVMANPGLYPPCPSQGGCSMLVHLKDMFLSFASKYAAVFRAAWQLFQAAVYKGARPRTDFSSLKNRTLLLRRLVRPVILLFSLVLLEEYKSEVSEPFGLQ